MLNNFIYAKLKSLFEEKLAANEVPQEAIVFIEDTKEIWNHGTYFPSGKSIEEIENIVASSETVQSVMEQIVLDTLDSLPVSIVSDGDGNKFLSDDGTYKEILTEIFTSLSTNDTSTVSINPNNVVVFNSTQTFESKLFNIIIPEEINKEYTWTLRFVLGDTTPIITFNTPAGYTLKWANNTVPTFSANTAYEITFKHIPGVNLLLGVCGGF
jgi:hypothetical protein